jgi:hypothetical protein
MTVIRHFLARFRRRTKVAEMIAWRHGVKLAAFAEQRQPDFATVKLQKWFDALEYLVNFGALRLSRAAPRTGRGDFTERKWDRRSAVGRSAPVAAGLATWRSTRDAGPVARKFEDIHFPLIGIHGRLKLLATWNNAPR